MALRDFGTDEALEKYQKDKKEKAETVEAAEQPAGVKAEEKENRKPVRKKKD